MQNERLAYERILEQPARRQVRHHRGHNHHASPTFILAGDVVPRYDSRCVRRDAPERTDPQPNPLRCDPGPPLQPDLRLAHAAPDSYAPSPNYHAGWDDHTLPCTLLDPWRLHSQVQWGHRILYGEAERSGEQH